MRPCSNRNDEPHPAVIPLKQHKTRQQIAGGLVHRIADLTVVFGLGGSMAVRKQGRLTLVSAQAS